VSNNQSPTIYKNTILEVIVTLSREEGMIQLVEEWLQVGLDLRPVTAVEGDYHSIKLSNRNSVANNIHNKIIIKIDRETLLQLPIPNWNSLSELYINSSEISANVTLSSSTIDVNYREKIEKDTILLIPETFSKGWIITARANIIPSVETSVHLGDNLQTFHIDNESLKSQVRDEGSKSAADYLSISLDDVELPFHLLFGWSNRGKYIIKKALNHYSLQINIEDSCIAKGKLISISNGYGVYITEVL
jgi:hypothetical protein